MKIPWQQLDPPVLYALLEEFVTRDGTDYGFDEVGTETKIQQLKQQLKQGNAVLVWDSETESSNIININQYNQAELSDESK